MLKNDAWIADMARSGMITPFEPKLIRRLDSGAATISYGLSSFGYDLRLSPKEFKIFRHIPGTVVDPKNFNPHNLDAAFLQSDANGQFFILPAHSYGLGVALERLEIPDNITCLFIGKSSYARCFRGDTRVALVDGTAPTLEDMAERSQQGEQFWGYSVGSHGRLMVTLLESPRYIGRDSLIEIVLDNGESIFCTPDHQFLRRDGRMAEAHTLKPQDSLMPLYRQLARGYDQNFSRQQQERAWKFWHDPQYAETRAKLIDQRQNCSEETRQAHREAMLRYYQDSHARALTSKLSKQAWANDDGARRAKQSQLMKEWVDSTKTRNDITAEVLRSVLDQTGSIRGAARMLNCDRSVFRRFPDVVEAFRGKKSNVPVKNHKVSAIRDVAGIHDVYCLSVPEAGNFALDAGVFVHNCGIIANLTPGEAGWRGYLTLEISNASAADCRIYANEGIVQALFLEGDPCQVSYEARQGKYQDQAEEIVIARV